MKKKILLTLLAIIVIIQFIRPSKNKSTEISANDISRHYAVQANVDGILKRSCNDCHTNNTTYPWYTNIQPVGWWMQWHVNEGKSHLNLSEFATYAAKRQHHKLEEVIEMVKEGAMPLNSYLWIHGNAKLSAEDQATLVNWADVLMKEITIKNNLPAVEKK
ncbi:MAG: heme-binding domain-containing protein [Chitinophagaceae bacterium]|nr:heme-binding domain-containing protein [Chitinophagaceae bacterium]